MNQTVSCCGHMNVFSEVFFLQHFFILLLKAEVSPQPVKLLWHLWLGDPSGSRVCVVAECDCVKFSLWLQG